MHITNEMDLADSLVPNGSRGRSQGGSREPPPYMPDLEAQRGNIGMGTVEANAIPMTTIAGYGKDGDFPGLREG